MRNQIKLFLLGTLALAACSQDETITNNDGGKTGITMTVKDYVVDGATRNTTRSSLDIADNGVTTFSWQTGDLVGVFGKSQNQQVRFDISDGAGTKSATFESADYMLRADNQYVSYYPMVNDVTVKANEIKISYEGQTQQANNDYSHLSDYEHLCSAATTPSATNTAEFNFSHIGAIVRLQLSMPCAGTWTSLTLSADDGSKPFTTAATLDLFGSTLVNPTATSDSITLTLGDITTTEEGDTLTAWLMLPPTNLSGKTVNVVVTDENGTNVEGGFAGYNLEAGTAYSFSTETVQLVTKTAGEAAVGDYFMKDGTLISCLDANGDTLTSLPDYVKSRCIGVVFALASDAGESDKSTYPDGMTVHGYVVALKNAVDGSVAWAPEYKDITDVEKDNESIYTDWSGYKNTQAILAQYPSATDIAAYYAVNYSPAAPSGTSGWFLPGAGQLEAALDSIYNGSSVKTSFSNAGGEFNSSVHYWSSTQRKFDEHDHFYFLGKEIAVLITGAFYLGYIQPAFEIEADQTLYVRPVLAF